MYNLDEMLQRVKPLHYPPTKSNYRSEDIETCTRVLLLVAIIIIKCFENDYCMLALSCSLPTYRFRGTCLVTIPNSEQDLI